VKHFLRVYRENKTHFNIVLIFDLNPYLMAKSPQSLTHTHTLKFAVSRFPLKSNSLREPRFANALSGRIFSLFWDKFRATIPGRCSNIVLSKCSSELRDMSSTLSLLAICMKAKSKRKSQCLNTYYLCLCAHNRVDLPPRTLLNQQGNPCRDQRKAALALLLNVPVKELRQVSSQIGLNSS